MRKPRHFKLIIVLAVLVALMGIVYFRYTHSFSYQYTAARQADANKDYDKAIVHYRRALGSDPEDIKTLCALGEDYLKTKHPASAEIYLLRAVKLDGKYEKSFELLLKLYESEGDYNRMENIYKYAKSDSVKKIFKDYLIKPPEFSVKGGKFSDDVSLTLSLPKDADEDYQIFYTTDGKAPNGVHGHLYDGSVIFLTQGKTKVRAVCRNKNGKFGEVSAETFNIKYIKPEEPKVTPNGGTFKKKTKVKITAGEDCTIYYSWTNKNPDKKSKKYTKKITVPKGYHVLSVVAYDKHELKSKTYHMGFMYYPESE
ncbi:MAG: hypothetical protein DUD27_07485 [Lachnospiraceae bacterium]|uniref:GH29D-like beta-sandwich domain-containing protein n=1 Tax=Candidatus Weimeria bifida TaxID=2599074 RepID=A0A6N7IY49_9FIRM|nr:hypothetical protein [Candidatus Weimeria bifida]RRF95680.1 MAG: hypothetical protein DUD27_07485 [Lachnospiraceae bacterium]